jgi:hypothetical protein
MEKVGKAQEREISLSQVHLMEEEEVPRHLRPSHELHFEVASRAQKALAVYGD